MKIRTLGIIAGAAILALASCKQGGQEAAPVNLASNIDSVSYAIGMTQAKNIAQSIPEMDVDLYLKGYADYMDSTVENKISDEEMQTILNAYSIKKRQAEQMEKETQGEIAKQQGLAFLEENKKNPDVVVTPSGLQYIVMKEGTGVQPTATSNVTVHYHGTTPEGVVFDSSVDRGEPATFGLNQVIRGWTEGVALMKEGAKYKFFIPQELAYGANPRPGGPIKPYMPLVFEVELIKVNN